MKFPTRPFFVTWLELAVEQNQFSNIQTPKVVLVLRLCFSDIEVYWIPSMCPCRRPLLPKMSHAAMLVPEVGEKFYSELILALCGFALYIVIFELSQTVLLLYLISKSLAICSFSEFIFFLWKVLLYLYEFVEVFRISETYILVILETGLWIFHRCRRLSAIVSQLSSRASLKPPRWSRHLFDWY